MCDDPMLHFSADRHEHSGVGSSRSRTQNRKRHLSSSSDSFRVSPAARRRRRSSPSEAIWVPAETSNTNLAHLVGSSKFTTSRAYDDSRVNPERMRNLSEGTASDMFGPTLPPTVLSKDAENRSGSDIKKRRLRTSKDKENSSRKMTGKSVRKSAAHSGSDHKHKVTRSRDRSSTARGKRSSRSRSPSSATSGSSGSQSRRTPRARSGSSVPLSRSRRKAPGTRRSRSLSSHSDSGREVRVRRSSSSSSRSVGSRHRSKSRTKESRDFRSNGGRKGRGFVRLGSYDRRTEHTAISRFRNVFPRKNRSFSFRRKSRSSSRDRTRKEGENWSGRKGENVDHQSERNTDRKERRPSAKSTAADKDVHGIPLANYTSSDSDDGTKTSRNKSEVAEKTLAAAGKVTDSKQPTSGRISDTIATVAAEHDKNARAKPDDKPKETLEDMELFLKQLKANKQQQMLKK